MHKQLEHAQNKSTIRSIHQPHPPISAVSDLGPVVCDLELVASTATTVRPLVRVVELGADYAGQKKILSATIPPGPRKFDSVILSSLNCDVDVTSLLSDWSATTFVVSSCITITKAKAQVRHLESPLPSYDHFLAH
jgi:hypothetical protein